VRDISGRGIGKSHLAAGQIVIISSHCSLSALYLSQRLAARKVADHRFHPPLDIVDGAARIVDPIITGVNTGQHVWGQFLKDFRPTDW